MNQLKHKNAVYDFDNQSYNVMADVYQTNNNHFISCIAYKKAQSDERYSVLFDVHDNEQDAVKAVESIDASIVKLGSTERMFTNEQLDQLDLAYINADDQKYNNLTVFSTRLTKNVVQLDNGHFVVGHIEYNNRCTNSEKCIVLSSVSLCTGTTGKYSSDTVKVWKEIHVFDNVEQCAKNAREVVQLNANMMETFAAE